MDVVYKMYEGGSDLVTLLEDSDWIVDGSSQHMSSIVLYDGKCYQINEVRTGSYEFGYKYRDPVVFEVEAQIIQKTIWLPI